MVNDVAADEARAAERALAVRYAPAERRGALSALLALDDALGGLLRTAREPLAVQLRLAWWRDALAVLGEGAAAEGPVLAGLAREVLPRGVDGAALAGLVDGWEALLAEPLDAGALAAHAAARGGGLFALAARVLGGEEAGVRGAGEGWALADVAARLSDPARASAAAAMAGERLAAALARRWPLAVRSLGALAWLARLDLPPHQRPPGHPARVARLLRFRVFGR